MEIGIEGSFEWPYAQRLALFNDFTKPKHRLNIAMMFILYDLNYTFTSRGGYDGYYGSVAGITFNLWIFYSCGVCAKEIN